MTASSPLKQNFFFPEYIFPTLHSNRLQDKAGKRLQLSLYVHVDNRNLPLIC